MNNNPVLCFATGTTAMSTAVLGIWQAGTIRPRAKSGWFLCVTRVWCSLLICRCGGKPETAAPTAPAHPCRCPNATLPNLRKRAAMQQCRDVTAPDVRCPAVRQANNNTTSKLPIANFHSDACLISPTISSFFSWHCLLPFVFWPVFFVYIGSGQAFREGMID